MENEQPFESSMDPSLAADRYEAGRMEEYLHMAGVKAPSLAGLQKKEYQREVKDLLEKICTKMPSLLPWVEAWVIGVVNPHLRVEKIDAALERVYEREPDATPRRAASEVQFYKRLPEKRFNYVWHRAQVVKKRLQKRKERAELSGLTEDC